MNVTAGTYASQVLPALLLATVTAAPRALAGQVVLENNSLLVAFDTESGALIRLKSKPLSWTIERRPALGLSFRLSIPLPGRQFNFVLGREQHADRVEKVSDHEVRLQWKNLLSEHGGVLPVTFTSTIGLTNGALTFDGVLENNSPLTIATIDYPYLGDLNPPRPNTPMTARTMWYGNLGADEIHPRFTNEKGYWGDFYPTKTFDSCRSLFCLIQSPAQGLYIGMHDPTQPYLLQYTFEQHPGVTSGILNSVPREDRLEGRAVHLEFRTCHFIFAHPHSTVKLAPVVLRAYRGDWHAGVEVYKQWRATWFKPPRIPDWVRQVNSWQQIQVNTPEQNYAVPYTNLIQYGEDCASNGVSAIQLVGWNHGGQDGGNPSFDTDPGLGTWQQLHDAIARIQRLGVKIVLFGKLPWADMTTAWYRRELHRYAATDPYGIPYVNGGDSYITPTQLAGINNHRFAVMDFLDPAYQHVATQEFQKLLALGASGWLYDEVPTHGPAKYSFAHGHGYVPPGYIYRGDLPMAAHLRAAADAVDRDFLFAGEGPQDWLTQYYPLSYFRINGSSTPVCRYLDPHAPLMVAVTGFDNREMLNLSLLDRYIISYEPYNFKGRLRDFPLTLAYGRKIDALRRRYADYLWNGTFHDTIGATVTAPGCKPYPAFVTRSVEGLSGDSQSTANTFRYSVFDTSAGKRAVVVVNQDFTKAITATVELPHPGRFVTCTPEEPEARPSTGTLRIPARSAAVLMEQ